MQEASPKEPPKTLGTAELRPANLPGQKPWDCRTESVSFQKSLVLGFMAVSPANASCHQATCKT